MTTTQPPPRVGKGSTGGALDAFFVTPAVLLGRGIKETAKRPKLLLGETVLVAAWAGASQEALTAACAGLTIAPGVWYLADRESFQRIVTPAARNLYRRLTIYQGPWRATMRTLNLHQPLEGKPDRYPRLLRVESGEWMDRLLVRPCRGNVKTYRDRAADIATQYGAGTCRIRKAANPRDLWIELRTGDPLAEPIKPPPPDPHVDLEHVQVGITEDGLPWVLKILGRHLLLSGETGAGKSSLIWAVLWAIAPLIRSGYVEVWAIDPKGGMELGPGYDAGLFARYADEDIDAMVKILTDARARMDEHKASARARGGRKHVPTLQQPYVIVIVDEAAVLRLLTEGKDQAILLDRSLKLLLTQGRAPGVTLISARQVPAKENDPTRDLYPNRVQFRTMERLHFGMTLAPGVLEYIEPELLNMPGKAFYLIEGQSEPGLGRVFHVEDADIEWLGEQFRDAPMKDLNKYGEHLREVVDQVRALPPSEQRSQAIRSTPKTPRC